MCSKRKKRSLTIKIGLKGWLLFREEGSEGTSKRKKRGGGKDQAPQCLGRLNLLE